MISTTLQPIAVALLIATSLLSPPSSAVRINADGHGQALIYPYYTARSTRSGNSYATALAIANTTASAKAVKVRFIEGKVGAEVLDFNLYLDAYDMWTGGVVALGAGAGLFTQDHSCTSPEIATNPAAPTPFRNTAYVSDLIGDTLDRTYEGYIEVLEMATADSSSSLAGAIRHRSDFTSPNASRPSCANLAAIEAAPPGLAKPTGGLEGNLSFINVNEGTDFSVDAIAFTRWSDKVQWSAPGNAHPNIADVSPRSSYVVDDITGRAFITQWANGRDAITALLMADHILNDFTVEPAIKGATDWVMTMPTKRFYVDAAHAESPFTPRSVKATSSSFICERLATNPCGGQSLPLFDREGQSLGASYICGVATPSTSELCGVATGLWLTREAYPVLAKGLLGSATMGQLQVDSHLVNGWVDVDFIDRFSNPPQPPRKLTAPASATTIVDLATGESTSGATVAYYGLPVVGFAAQAYSTSGLPGVNPNVLSNYGGQFNHKIKRRVEVEP